MIWQEWFRDQFLSTPSARRATVKDGYLFSNEKDFYPRPPRGGRHCTDSGISRRYTFLSTPSARRATAAAASFSCAFCYFYPRPPRGGRPAISMLVVAISIFLSTPSARRATMVVNEKVADRTIFLSTPSARRATSGELILDCINLFLSTPSARRATAKTETKSLFSNKLYNILHEFRRALIYNGSKSYPNHAK